MWAVQLQPQHCFASPGTLPWKALSQDQGGDKAEATEPLERPQDLMETASMWHQAVPDQERPQVSPGAF